jgi:hypothetical protein
MSSNNGPGVKFKHAPATRESNDALLPRVVAGDAAAIEEMILANMAMVTKKVTTYLEQFPQCNHLKDDLLSQGYLGLVAGVKSMVGQKITDPNKEVNPTGKMSQYIHYYLGEVLDVESAVRVPMRTWQRKRDNGHTIDVPTKESSITVEHVFQKEAAQDPRAVVDLLDEIYGCCENDTEKEIVRLRTEGRKDDEIATILELPKTTTYMMRRGIYQRFLERNPEIRGEV